MREDPGSVHRLFPPQGRRRQRQGLEQGQKSTQRGRSPDPGTGKRGGGNDDETEGTTVNVSYDRQALNGAHRGARLTPPPRDREGEMDLGAVCVSPLWHVVERPHRTGWMLVDPRGRIRCFGDLVTLGQVASRLNGLGVMPDG
jgi:hypothetical protein